MNNEIKCIKPVNFETTFTTRFTTKAKTMNNKFKSNSPEEAKAWLTEMFAQGAEWSYSGKDIMWLNYKYYYCENNIVWCSNDDSHWHNSTLPEYELKNSEPKWHQNTGVDYINQTILTPDFSNVQAGDRVKCVMYGEGVVVAVDTNGSFPIYVKFLNANYASYTLNGCFSGIANPTLFYHFSGQFPTAEACVRPKPDAYKLHGVTREEIKKYVDAVELLNGVLLTVLKWNENGISYFVDEDGDCYNIPLNHPAPYPHWQTPIVLGGE